MKIATTLLIFCVGALLTLSMVFLHSAAMLKEANYFGMQLIWCAIGLGACVFAASLDYRILKDYAWYLLAFCVLLLILVLIPSIGTYANGARRWLDLGIARFQPSEAAKLGLIIALAAYADRYQRSMHSIGRGLIVPGLVMAVVLVPIYVEPDRGTTILLAAVGGIMLLIAGVRVAYLVPPALMLGAGLAYALWFDAVRRARILSWLNPEAFREGTGRQAWQSIIALGNGGVQGVGLGNGRQKLGFISEHHTDFIFSVIGEELGLMATGAVVILFVIFVLAGVYIAWNSNSTFGLLLGSGITFLVGLQAFINIGVVTGTLPNKGLALPFVSYGGSNLLIMLTCVGLLLSIARHSADEKAEADESVASAKVLSSQLA